MRICLLYAHANFVGPEYYQALCAAGLEPSLVVEVGLFKDEQIAAERRRTGGRWAPPAIPRDRVDARFDGLKDPALWDLLRAHDIDVAIQAGIGILKPDMIAVPQLGFLNIHPGKLPEYRGCSCPEWAVLNGDPVYATAHFIDGGIDTGPVILSSRYHVQPTWDYWDFRANIYAHAGATMVAALRLLSAADDPRNVAVPQSEDGACYRPLMTDEQMALVRACFPGWAPRDQSREG